jgi:hypothetical protein
VRAIKTKLDHLQQAIKACSAAPGRQCRCEGPCWLRDSASAEPPPTHCWSCGGSNPPGLVYVIEVVEADTQKDEARS